MIKKGLDKIGASEQEVETIILGTFPGDKSLELGEYYQNNSNKFWEVLGAAVVKNMSYEKKKKFLSDNCLMIWDAYDSCERVGSKDSEIKRASINDKLASLIQDSPRLKRVICNGSETKEAIIKHLNKISIELICLPSTSGANPKDLNSKINSWKKALA